MPLETFSSALRPALGKAPLAVAVALVLAIPAASVPHALAQAQPPATHGPASVADLAEGLLDAVVNISTSQAARGGRGGQRNVPRPGLPEGSPFQEFFDDFFNDRGGRGGGDGGGRRVQSLGSGFIIDAAEGIVVTNNHVIADADEIEANFADGGKLKAELVGTDPQTDIAVLKVDPSLRTLTQVEFGDSSAIRIGDWVMAIGNPFGLGGSVSIGIVSARGRDINSGPYDDFIQTDAAINRGNSGGPLFDMHGRVIGINTAIISPSGGSIGIGFSIPSQLAVGVIDQLREFGETRRGWLGVRIQPATNAPRASSMPRLSAMSSVTGWMRTPSQPRRVSPNWRSWSMTLTASCDGIEKPMPIEPPEGEMIAVLMPMTLPCMSNSGPPELPRLIAASVWMKSS